MAFGYHTGGPTSFDGSAVQILVTLCFRAGERMTPCSSERHLDPGGLDKLARQSDGAALVALLQFAWQRSAAHAFSPDASKRLVLRPAVVWAGCPDSLRGLQMVREGQTCRNCDRKAASVRSCEESLRRSPCAHLVVCWRRASSNALGSQGTTAGGESNSDSAIRLARHPMCRVELWFRGEQIISQAIAESQAAPSQT